MEEKSTEPRMPGTGALALAIVAAALILAWGGGKDEPRYQLAASGSAVYRMDSDSGELIACTERGCARVEAPDRAKTLGAIELRLPGGRQQAGQKALPAPETNSQ
jgi:hypothetical protein